VKREVKVFSNCAQVELIVNGVSQGKHDKDISKYPASGLSWKIDFAEGDNTLIAIGTENGTVLSSDTLMVNYTYQKIEKPEEIVFSSKRLTNGNYLVTARVVDKNGRLCSDFNRKIYFDLNGSGSLVTYSGGPVNSAIIEAANGQASIEVKTVPSESSVLEVRTQDFKGHYYKLPE
jgi:beta-galactosidase